MFPNGVKLVDTLQQELSKSKVDLESRTKKHDMQLTALNQNLSTVRSDLKIANEKLTNYEQLKTEKNGMFADDLFNQVSFILTDVSQWAFRRTFGKKGEVHFFLI
ncbi:unnamed protein product [Didymodactylos carnosus]|uniref:Uncharacterized protein n=1 Tax=Didymodactylos carnosus TaxID=1234261 RepID=A0A8S2JWA8_9BILA|nr:unnamed protein product [Didymodactylos carnosus]CAF3827906.1 unnamed protein product [Didymodactylos carnosus]